MKKLFLFITLTCCITGQAFSQLTYVPDDHFEQALIDFGYDNTLDNNVLTSNINTVNYLNLYNYNISDLTGISGFTALTSLSCSSNHLTTLDVSQNTALTFLTCNSNQLTSINLSANSALLNLNCSNNLLSTLDITQNIALTSLNCSDNLLTSLNISQNTALSTLVCFNNQLTSLDVSQNIGLHSLTCSNNLLTSLNISQNSALTSLLCNGNQLTSLNLNNGNNQSMTVNFTINPQLYCILVDDSTWSTNHWTSIDPQNYFSTTCICNLVVSVSPASLSLTTGSGGQLTPLCESNVSYQWLTNIGNMGWLSVPENSTYTTSSGGTFSVNNVQLANHQQAFKVIATLGNCSDTSDVVNLLVSDTCIVLDTTFITQTIYDTTFVNETIYDTTYLTVYDTTYVNETIYDTTYITLYDTLYTSVTDTLVIDAPLGLPSPNDFNTIAIYPNPAKDHITIDNGNYLLMGAYSIKITNDAGQVLFNNPVNQAQFYLDITTWTGNGVYFVHLIDQNGSTVTVRKIVIQ
jgi:hypothetical protein